MHIVHITSAHPAYDTRIFYKECRSLTKEGYQVTLCVPHTREELIDGVRILPVTLRKGRLLRMLTSTFDVFRKALQLHADLYHFHDPELVPLGLLLMAMGKRVIYDIHEDVPRSILSRDYMHPMARRVISWLFERLENFAATRFSALVSATPAISRRFAPLNPTAQSKSQGRQLKDYSNPIGFLLPARF